MGMQLSSPWKFSATIMPTPPSAGPRIPVPKGLSFAPAREVCPMALTSMQEESIFLGIGLFSLIFLGDQSPSESLP